MNVISSLNAKHFTFNGVQYFRNYVSAVHGDKVEIYNCFERKDVLVPLSHFSEFNVNGSSFTSANLLQAALLDVTYTRLTGTDSSVVDQDNVAKVISVGMIGPLNSGQSMLIEVANKLNAKTITITAKETPVIILATEMANNGMYNYISKRYKYLFKRGKGNWGLGGSEISLTYLELINTENLLANHLLSEPNAVINNLGSVPDGDYLTVANATEWDFLDSGLETDIGPKTYYFSYETDDVLYFVQFMGAPDLYGGVYDLKFTADDFVSSTDSRITEVPKLEEVIAQGGNLNISQLVNNGNGTSPYATIAQLNGLSLIVNQAAAEMYLKNGDNVTLATINLGFLNNEGTRFFYNEATEKLELKNDAGEVLSQIPVSAFVSNLMQSVNFNAVLPQQLEFKDAEGNIVDLVTFTINNVQGLQSALDTKANKNGSNASGTWPIHISGNATTADAAGVADLWGGAYADFATDGDEITYAVGYKYTGVVKKYSATIMKQWLNITTTDVSNLANAFALKANDNEVLHKTGDELKTGNLTLNGQLSINGNFGATGLGYFGGAVSVATGTETGHAVNLGQLNSIDNSSLHKSGQETITGIKTVAEDVSLKFGNNFLLTNRSDFDGLALGIDGISENTLFINKSTGNVAINNKAALLKLDVLGTLGARNPANNVGVTLNVDAITPIIQATSGDFISENALAINPYGGNVSIGSTDNGGYKLDVAGQIRASGAISTKNSPFVITSFIAGNDSAPAVYEALSHGVDTSSAKIKGYNTHYDNYGAGWKFSVHTPSPGVEIDSMVLATNGDVQLAKDLIVGDIGNETSFERRTIEFAKTYDEPGQFGINSNGDKIVLYQGVNYDGRIGVGNMGNLWIKSFSADGGNAGSIELYTKNATTSIQLTKIHGSGNISVGSGTDAGFKLDVHGPARINGELTIANGTDLNSAITLGQIDSFFEQYINSMVVIDRTYTSSSWFNSLNSRYPNAKILFRVIAISAGGWYAECVKTGVTDSGVGKWLIIPGNGGGEVY